MKFRCPTLMGIEQKRHNAKQSLAAYVNARDKCSEAKDFLKHYSCERPTE